MRTVLIFAAMATSLSACEAQTWQPKENPIVWPDIKSADFRCGRLPVQHRLVKLQDQAQLKRRVVMPAGDKFTIRFNHAYILEGPCAPLIVEGSGGFARLSNLQTATIRRDGWMIDTKRAYFADNDRILDSKLVEKNTDGNVVKIIKIKSFGKDQFRNTNTYLSLSNKPHSFTVNQIRANRDDLIESSEKFLEIDGKARSITFFRGIHGDGGTITLTIDNGPKGVLFAAFDWQDSRHKLIPH